MTAPRSSRKTTFGSFLKSCWLVLAAVRAVGGPVETAFNYQGQFEDGGKPATGLYDLRFTLHDAATEGSVLGTQMLTAAAIADGLYTATLDFGAGAFDGSARWLELAIRTNGVPDFTVLAPRQPLSPTPYALYAPLAGNAATANTAANAASVAAVNITGTLGLGQLPTAVLTNGARGVALSGAFTGDGTGLSNLDSLKLTGLLTLRGEGLVGGYDTAGFARGVGVVGQYAYVADDHDGLQVINISDPAHPEHVGHYDTYDNSGDAYGVAVAGQYAYMAVRRGLLVIDISNPAHPERVGGSDTPGKALGVAVAGQYAYVVDDIEGLQVIDISDPAHPQRVGSYDTAGNAYGVTVAGNYAYVADGTEGLQVIVIGGRAAMQRAGGYRPKQGIDARGVAVVGQYAYVADYRAGLLVIDISDPANPRWVGSRDTPGYARGVAVDANYACVADDIAGLQVIDISDPSDPRQVGDCSTSGAAFGVAVAGNYAYVADSTAGLRIVAVESVASVAGTVQADTVKADTVKAGTVGIGTSSLTAPLTVAAPALSAGENTATFRLLASGYSPSYVHYGTTGDWYIRSAAATGKVVLQDTGGNVGIGTGSPTARLMVVNARCDGSSWINASDRNLKQGFEPVDAQAVLDKVAALPLQTWSYKAQPGEIHLGPVAQDFRAAFGLGADDVSIATVDEAGVALAAIQGLNQKVVSENATLREELRRREADNAELKARLERLEQLVRAQQGGGR